MFAATPASLVETVTSTMAFPARSLPNCTCIRPPGPGSIYPKPVISPKIVVAIVPNVVGSRRNSDGAVTRWGRRRSNCDPKGCMAATSCKSTRAEQQGRHERASRLHPYASPDDWIPAGAKRFPQSE